MLFGHLTRVRVWPENMGSICFELAPSAGAISTGNITLFLGDEALARDLVAAMLPVLEERGIEIVNDGVWKPQSEPAPAPEPPPIQRMTEEGVVTMKPATPDADGWIEWGGGDCPVGHLIRLRVKTRCNVEGIGLAGDFYWAAYGGPGEITAYRFAEEEG
jgi:hypothetical protein